MRVAPLFSWITPFQKQCWVTLGVSLNMAEIGLVVGISGVLLPQLKLPGSSIQIDDESGSWIASIPGIALMAGNLAVPSIMGYFGRKPANIFTLFLFIISWSSLALSTSVTFLIASRCLQGIAMGMIATLGPVLVGEYTSPRNRGAFLASISLFIAFGVMYVHTIGSYYGWEVAAFSVAGLSAFNLLIVMLSPESPSWLSNKGRFDECRVNFRWLRGNTEDDELEKMIASSSALRTAEESERAEDFKTRMKNNVKYYVEMIKAKEFYKPFIILIHVYAMTHWSGVNLVASYAVEFIDSVVGKEADIPMAMLTLNLTRIIGQTMSLFLIHKIKRRKLMFAAIGTNVGLMFFMALYTYIKTLNLIKIDSYYDYYIGMTLTHLLIFVITMGALPLGFILAGELLPLRYKSLAGGLCCLVFSLNIFVNIKTIPYLLSNIGIYGLLLLYGGLLMYLLTLAGFMLPETKDKTLQDIEEEFKGQTITEKQNVP